jgi:alpha-1,2-mannosyltransferase
MTIYPSLPVPVVPQGAGSNFTVGVCVGGEWYRFPSSFHLPSPAYRLHFVDSSFDGALPVPFDPAAGGTRFSPAGLNDKNEVGLVQVESICP